MGRGGSSASVRGRGCKFFLVLLFSAVLFFSLCMSSFAITWANFHVFDGGSAPYASSGPGCRPPGSQGSAGSMSPGQNCGNGSVANDIGAIWVDMDSDFIAWMVMGPFNASAGFCNVTGSFNNSLLIEFDSDNNFSTGCQNGGYTGSDYKIVLQDGVGRFMYHNSSFSTDQSGFMINSSINVSMHASCSTGSLKFAVPRSAIANLQGMRFETNTITYVSGFQLWDSLGHSGDQMFMQSGQQDFMFMDQHPCFSYRGTNSSACVDNSQNITGADNCLWDSFRNDCNPDFAAAGCSEFCGACSNSSDCQSGGKGKCTIVTAPPMLPPDAKNFTYNFQKSMCVEDMSKVIFGSGSCDNDCKFCYSNSTCSNSVYPNPSGSGSGCKWVTDPNFGKSWCDLSTTNFNFNCASTNFERCLNQTGCQAVGGNWSSEFNFCWNASTELCFDGRDNNNNSLVDCADSVFCSKDPACGGNINVLTGGFGTLNPFEAMKKSMFQDMDPSPPVNLFFDSSVDSLPSQIDIRDFSIKDMGSSLGLGVGVIGMINRSGAPPFPGISLLCGGNASGRYYFFLDSDSNLSSGCNITLNSVQYAGFDYRFEYEILSNGSGGVSEIRKSFRCLNNANFSLFPAKMAGSPVEAFFGDKPVACEMDVAILAVDKTDIGNPRGNMRFMVSTSDNRTNYSSVTNANDTLLGPGNGGIYYTPGTIDFKPKDCFSNAMACGTAFSVIGGGKFMPFEDCFPSSGDEDLDGLTNCDDSDCSMAPWCSGTDYTTNDKTAPSVVGNKVETFNNFIFMHFSTNEPSNATITFHNLCSNSTARNTFYDLGDPTFTFDDYRPWHDSGISNGDTDALGSTISLASSTTYFYKLKVCDRASNCGTSSCLNFTTQGSAQQVQYKFDFVPPANALINTTSIKFWNGTAYESITQGQTNNKSNYVKNGKLLFNNSDANWAIELEGVDLAKAVSFDISSAFNVSNQSGSTYVGLGNQKWLDMAQNLGVSSVILKLPGTGTTLQKCNENNLSDCSDVTAQAVINETGADYVKWKIPTSLGFSTYTVASAAGVTIGSDKNVYSAYPNVIAYYNLTNSNSSLANIYNLTINNTAIAGVTFNISYYNGSAWIYTSSNNQTQLTNYNFTASTHQFRFNITMATLLSANWTVNFTLFNGSTLVSSYVDSAQLDAINLTLANGTSAADLTPDFTFKLFSSTAQACTLYVEAQPYGTNASVSNGTLTTITANTSLAETSASSYYSWYVDCSTTGISETRYMRVGINPSLYLTSPANNTNTTNNYMTFTFNATDDTLYADCNLFLDPANSTDFEVSSINMSSVVNVSTSISIADGLHNWSVECFDNYGNYNISATRFFTIDTKGPVYDTAYFAAVNISNSTPSTGNTIRFVTNWSDATMNVASVLWYVGSNIVNSTSSVTDGSKVNLSWTIPSTYIGAYTTYVWANDTLGNSNQTVNITLNISDASPPTPINLNSPSNMYNTTSNNLTFNFTAYDNYDSTFTCNLTIDGVVNSSGTVTNGTANITTVNGFSDGTHRWNVTCLDSYNNRNTSATYSFTVDTVAPVINSIVMADTYVRSGQSVLVTVNSTDAASGVASVSANGTSLSRTGDIWNNSFTIPSGSGVVSLNVVVTDYVGLSTANTSFQYIIDNTNPVISGELAGTSALSTTPSITNADGNVTFNWTVTEVNLTSTNLSIDSGVVINSSTTNGTKSFTTSLAAGLHTISFTALDEAGNTNTTTYSFRINAQENTTQILSALNSSSTVVNIITLSDNNTGADLSNNVTFLNATYDLKLNVSVASTVVEVTIPDFSGLDVNWNKTFVINTSMPTASSTAVGVLGTNVTQLVFFTGFENFLSSASYEYAEIIFKVNVDDLGLDVVYFSTDNATNVTKVTDECPESTTSSDVPCYLVNSTLNWTTLRIPHFSGGGLANDTIAPQITLTYPVNISTYSYSYNINFTGSVNETNVPVDVDSMCKYGINDSTPDLSVDLTLGSEATYSFSFYNTSALLNGSYYVTFNCTDLKNNSRILTHYFTVSDVSATVISTPSASVTSTTTTITFSVDEPANYSVNYGTTSALGTTSASSTKSVSSKSVSLSSLTASTLYYYNITVCDTNANCVTNGSYSLTTSAATTTSSSGGGGGGGAASTTSNVGSSVSHGWTNVVAGAVSTMVVNKTSIPVTELSFTAADGISSASVTVAVLIDAPNDTKVLASKVYKYLKVTEAGFTDADVSGAVLKFKVAKSWLTENSVSADSVVLSRYTSDWSELTTEMLSEDDSFVYFKATSPGMSYFAVTLKAGTVVTEKPATPAEEKNETVATETTEGAAGEQNEVAAGEQVVPTTQPPTTTTPPAKKGSAWLIVLVVVVLGLLVYLFWPKKKVS